MTTGSWGIDPSTGQFKIIRGSRVVSTTGGTLICLLPTLVSLSSVSVDFPDPQYKDYGYAYLYEQDRVAGIPDDHYRQSSQCQTFFTRRPEEYAANQTLIAAPAGADIFVGHIRVNRTTAPTHTWLGSTLSVLPKENAWIPITGSMLMEASLGISRAMHVFISGGNLILQREMSISTPAGGYGTQGAFNSPANDVLGGEVVYGTAEGLPVWTSTSSPYAKATFRDQDFEFPFTPSDYNPQRLGGSNPCSIVDPTNYRSIYSVDVKGHFGRRS